MPKPIYDLVVIGGGTAGLVSAAGAAGLGARVALIEQARLGGDCLNTGCVPSKALLHAAREGRSFAAALAHVRASRDAIAPHDSPERLTSLGVEVIFGHARFTGPRTVSVSSNDPHGSNDSNVPNDSSELRFRKAVIATGSRPAVPAIPGLTGLPFLTSDTVWDLTTRPRTMTVVGGGPIGCELSQAFARLGTRVTLIEGGPQLLPREDPDAAALVARALAADGVDVKTDVTIGHARDLAADAILIAVGRQANVEGLGLETAGIDATAEGIQVNDRLRTRNRRVFAAGDVASRYRFTHAADAFARIVIHNALFFGRRSASRLVIPWCTFTSPELAHVGTSAAEAAARGAQTVTVPLTEVDRAVVDGTTTGFVRLHHDRGRIVGATIVAPGAGELMSTVAYAMRTGGTLATLSGAVFPYPTLSLALRQAGDAYQRTRLTPAVRRLLKYYFGRSG